MTVRRIAGLVIALLMVAVGVLWTAQGFGWITGSQMSGQPIWAIVGPVVAGLGVALLIVVIQRIREPRVDDAMSRRYGR